MTTTQNQTEALPPKRVAVVNAGGWGTALASLLGNAGHDVRLWCRREELAVEISTTRVNSAYLPSVALPPGLRASSNLAECVDGAEAVILAPISKVVRETAAAVAPHLKPGTPVIHVAKGFEYPSLLRLSEVVEEELGAEYRGKTAALSGPTFAEEVARNLPTTAVVASTDESVAAFFQALLFGPRFRVYTSTDVVGVEMCGALKNVIALAAGGSDGLGFGDNAKAGLITRSLAELARLVKAAGGDPRTVSGLAGLGDVIATCTSAHSRNRWAGEQIGRGRKVDEILASTRQVVEGVPAARAAVALGKRYGVELPVCEEVCGVVYEGAPVLESLGRLMSREATAEL